MNRPSDRPTTAEVVEAVQANRPLFECPAEAPRPRGWRQWITAIFRGDPCSLCDECRSREKVAQREEQENVALRQAVSDLCDALTMKTRRLLAAEEKLVATRERELRVVQEVAEVRSEPPAREGHATYAEVVAHQKPKGAATRKDLEAAWERGLLKRGSLPRVTASDQKHLGCHRDDGRPALTNAQVIETVMGKET